ncbi:sulfotransferase family protein [Rhodosalinus halophilus]|uniref:Sulfotransferase family protein n=1 Tax=Rhodosalinus halophilus TaxID=2259333 RepID=A0A365U516_9RHOB|nr:sulfotransferase family protein [Rhodosalinus halophilus]RBI83380.1 sulfotransferase family protein [Rhodosalinus halophilus]
MSRVRVVNLGLPKSGTTTFNKALAASGLTVADHRIRPRQTPDRALHGVFVGDLMYRGYFGSGDPLAFFEGFDAISETSVMRRGVNFWPQTDFGLIEALRERHPDLRFVATRRPTADICASMAGWSNMLDRLPVYEIPGLPRGYGREEDERARWIDAHYAFLARIFAGSDAYLELDVAAQDAAERLSAHLGLEIAWWGRANARRETAG